MEATLEARAGARLETVSPPAARNWEAEIRTLLGELSALQTELLAVLDEKRQALAACSLMRLAELQPREEELSQRLEQCHQRRADLLEAARREDLPGTSLGKLAAAVNPRNRGKLGSEVKETAARMRLLQHHSLANWVLAQRSLLHVSQLLEIIATRGRMQPTYGDRDSSQSRGALVDQSA